MKSILLGPFRQRQAPQTSAALLPFQHWLPEKYISHFILIHKN